MTVPHPAAPPGTPVVLPVPPNAPRSHITCAERCVARWLLRACGWSMRGQWPDVPRAVVIAAPHSSNWDGIWIYFSTTAMGIDIRILGKPALFRIPVLGWVLRRYGGVPANEDNDQTVLDQAVALLDSRQHYWFGMSPEGTRAQTTRWKIGFWKIAKHADVPIVLTYLHYPDKVLGVLGVFMPGEDMRGDIERMRALYRPWQGKHHGID